MGRDAPLGIVILSKWAVYISSSRDFSHADRRRAAAHDMSAAVLGQAKRRRFNPAVFRVSTSV